MSPIIAHSATPDPRAPEAIQIVEPEVPVNYMRWKMPGHIVIEFQIDPDGRPTNIRVVASDNRRYAKNVKDAVRQWRFAKPEVAGITYRLPVHFSHKGHG